MSLCSDLINLENSEDWRSLVSRTFTAVKLNDKSHSPIPAQNLGVSTNAEYLAAIVNINEGRPTWLFGGDITQTYSFAGGGGGGSTAQIQSQPLKLFVNRLQLIQTPRYSIENYSIRFQPPYWFKDATIRIYEYIGVAANFTKDTLFDIGQKLGIDPSTDTDSINNKLDSLLVNLGDSFTFLEEDLRTLIDANSEKNDQIYTKLLETDAGIYTLGEGLSLLLPAANADALKSVLIDRLNLDLGFL